MTQCCMYVLTYAVDHTGITTILITCVHCTAPVLLAPNSPCNVEGTEGLQIIHLMLADYTAIHMVGIGN